ncbi:MAG: DUF4212 domain-containing protein [Hyphomicrobiaceae bacterium]
MKPNSPGVHAAIGRRRAILFLVLFAIFGIGLHLLAPTFNGLKLSGLPLGYWIAAQLGPLLLAVAFVWFSARKVVQ